jgi:integrase
MNAKRDRFPITVKRGSCVVKIYRDRKPTGTYYRVAYHIGGKRYRLNFVDLEQAKSEAEAQAGKLSRGDLDAALLTGKDRLVYGRALDALRETGVQLDAAALEYSEARKHLDGVSIVDAAKFYARHHGQNIKRKVVADAAREMIEAKTLEGVSSVYQNDLRYRLGVFSERLKCDLVSLTADDVRGFFDDLKLGSRSFNNFLGALKTFFRFAQDRGWLPKESDLLACVRKRKDKGGAIEILTPGEIANLLNNASPEIVSCLALGAFAGLRSEEILRLEWTDLGRRPGFVEIGAHKTKTATRRLVPISDNLAKWLALTSSSRHGLVWKNTKPMFFKIRRQVAARAGMKLKQNALRHSFISYRAAELQNINQVALEAGNSPQMIFRHYRELATPEQARSWFAIAPTETSNVVPLIVAPHTRRQS